MRVPENPTWSADSNPEKMPATSIAPLALAFLVLLALPATADEPLALHCGKPFDSEAGVILEARTVVVEGDTISAVEEGFTRSDGARVIDLREHTCLPGLMDMHVHLTVESGPSSRRPATTASRWRPTPTERRASGAPSGPG